LLQVVGGGLWAEPEVEDLGVCSSGRRRHGPSEHFRGIW
jgi:hypothetical protein